MTQRIDGRTPEQLRPVIIRPNFIKHPHGSVLIEMGDTKVICTASVEDRVPPFLMRSGKGWVTAEYGMLPAATNDRTQREAAKGKQGGRTMEIQRLIGRSLRAAVNTELMGERTIIVDCDVIQADGGTRTASITGGYVALVLALSKLYLNDRMVSWPLAGGVSAVSVGIVAGTPMLDLCYQEDSKADVDMNVVATDKLSFIELQGTAEKGSFSDEELTSMLGLARDGLRQLNGAQQEIIGALLGEVNEKAMKRLAKKFK